MSENENISLIEDTIKEPVPKKSRGLLPLVLSAAFLCFTLFIYAPLEMYLNNNDEIWFTLKDIWWIVGLTAIIAYAVIFLIGFLLRGKLRGIYTSLVFGGGLAVYIQGNFLALRFGTFNGQSLDWSLYKGKFIINILLWLLFLALPVVLYLFKDKIWNNIVKILSVLLIGLQLVSFAVTFSGAGEFEKIDKLTSTTPIRLTNKGLNELGENSNVIVFVMDFFDDMSFQAVQEQYPEEVEFLDGFTHFKNTTSSYTYTAWAIPNLLSGSFPSNGNPLDTNQMREDIFTHTDFYKDLVANDYSIGIYTNEWPDGYSKTAMFDNAEEVTAVPKSNWSLCKRLYRFVGTKYFPLVTLPRLWFYGSEFEEIKTQTGGTDDLYTFTNQDHSYYVNYLKNNPITISKTNKNSFKFIHTSGAHPPYQMNEYAQLVGGTDALKAARGILYSFKNYFAEMKEKDLYDDATIVIMADHGMSNGSIRPPLMLVKPKNARGPLQENNSPVMHNDLHATIMEDIGLNKDKKYGTSMFDIPEDPYRERIVYRRLLETDLRLDKPVRGHVKYIFDGVNNESWRATAGDTIYIYNDEFTTEPLSKYTLYIPGTQLDFKNAGKKYLDYLDFGLSPAHYYPDDIWNMSKQTQFSMTLDEPIRDEYTLSFKYGHIMGASQRIIIEINGKQLYTNTITQPNGEITFTIPKDIVEAGKIRITFRMPDAISEYYYYNFTKGPYMGADWAFEFLSLEVR